MTCKLTGLKGCAAALAVAISATLLVTNVPVPSDVLGFPLPSSQSPQITLVKYEWKDGPPMIVPRASPAVVVLQDGNVFVIGGTTVTGPTATTEVFDAKSSAWKSGPTMSTKRVGHTATLLKDGTVLVVGGDTGVGATATAEILDVSSGAASVVPSMSFARSGHAGVMLGNGKVLVTGGSNWVTDTWKQAEMFDRSSLKWIPAGSMSTPRVFFSMHVLGDGTALAIGGEAAGTSERYNATTNSWGLVSKMASPRYYFASAPTSGGILVAGGIVTDTPMNTSEMFSPTTNSWMAMGNMNSARAKISVEPLPNGDLLTEGSSSKLGTTATSEIFHPETSLWQEADPMRTARGAYGAATLPDGAVIVLGGKSGAGTTSSVEIYSPVSYEPEEPLQPIDLVPFVKAATELPGNSSDGLIAKLVAAQAKYDSSDFRVCLNIMHAFYNQVRAFASNEHMTRAHATAIYEGYVSVIKGMGGTPDTPFFQMTLTSVIKFVIRLQ